MAYLRRTFFLSLVLVPVLAFGQSADQEIVSVTDDPDPVTPGSTLTYTVTIRNNGPDAATNGGINIGLPLSVTRTANPTVPAGWSCAWLGHSGSCTTPSFTAGTTAVIEIPVTVNQSLASFADQTITASFFTSGTTSDPNNGNNSGSASTLVDSPQVDLEIVSATDSPDPVFPDGNVTYTVTARNNGPDTASNITFNAVSHTSLRFVSATIPAGWSCTLPTAGAINSGFSCTRASWAAGATSTFEAVYMADDQYFGIIDSTFSSTFSAHASASHETNHANNQMTVTTAYVTPDANLVISATDSPDPVANGNNVTFDVTIENAGPDAATNAVVTLSPHPSLVFQSLTAPAGWTCNTPAVGAAGIVQCFMNPLPSGATGSFQLVTKVVAGGAGGVLSSDFTISSNTQDPDQTNNSVTLTTTWVGQTSDLAIDKTTLSTAAAQGSTITYTISTTNHGPDEATNVTVTDVLPAQLRFQSITAPAGWTCTTPAAGANGTITCTAAALANGTTATFTLATSVAPNATGSIVNSATVSGAGTDPNTGNSSGSSPGVSVAGNADLGVTKTTTATSAAAGETITYTVGVTNAGPDPAASVVLTDVLPAGLLFQSITAPAGWTCTTPAVGTNGTIACTADTLANGATATLTLVTTVAAGTSGTIQNSATVGHSGTDGNEANSSGSTEPLPVESAQAEADLSVTKATAATAAVAGTNITYTITVANAGPATATNVVVNDTLPAGLAFVSATPSQGSCNASSPVACNLGSIASGGTATISLVARVTATSGTISNTATVSAAEADPDSGDLSATTSPIPAMAPETAQIPTLSEWALMALIAMLGAVALLRVRF